MEIDHPESNEKASPNSIPAINLLMDPNYNLTLQEIARKFPKSVNKLIKGYISITADSEENRNNTLKYLNENDKEYILSERQEDRPLKIVFKNLPITHSTDLIKQDLKSKNFKIIRIGQLKDFKTNPPPHPIFLFEIAKTENSKNIYNIKTVNFLNVKIETYRKTNKATMCFKCSRFHHSARNCMRKAKCIKCAKNHETKDCPTKTKIDTPKCINCQETGHLASWRGCPKFPIITLPKNKPSYAQTENQPN
ncbi:Nucleic-acid-binding protein from transposon X-element [Araneus ventricosus]|uniref:Nucleic-acid-binding protein from transposon X-element n=1 Tax=Araneus ventricosus TaxID=182803 RepID=A0A4Y2TI99_ARAVE|nr:Nucleic-acid-binding protein from transposon X-element [Araneus ventricosus]GBO00319.1 Nucleic-acid-binding protein from transposon X-element [Araneus ventricosus]